MLLGDPFGRLPAAEWVDAEQDPSFQLPTVLEEACGINFLRFLNKRKQRYDELNLRCFFEGGNEKWFSYWTNNSILASHCSSQFFTALDDPGIHIIYPELRLWIEQSRDESFDRA